MLISKHNNAAVTVTSLVCRRCLLPRGGRGRRQGDGQEAADAARQGELHRLQDETPWRTWSEPSTIIVLIIIS